MSQHELLVHEQRSTLELHVPNKLTNNKLKPKRDTPLRNRKIQSPQQQKERIVSSKKKIDNSLSDKTNNYQNVAKPLQNKPIQTGEILGPAGNISYNFSDETSNTPPQIIDSSLTNDNVWEDFGEFSAESWDRIRDTMSSETKSKHETEQPQTMKQAIIDPTGNMRNNQIEMNSTILQMNPNHQPLRSFISNPSTKNSGIKDIGFELHDTFQPRRAGRLGISQRIDVFDPKLESNKDSDYDGLVAPRRLQREGSSPSSDCSTNASLSDSYGFNTDQSGELDVDYEETKKNTRYLESGLNNSTHEEFTTTTRSGPLPTRRNREIKKRHRPYGRIQDQPLEIQNTRTFIADKSIQHGNKLKSTDKCDSEAVASRETGRGKSNALQKLYSNFPEELKQLELDAGSPMSQSVMMFSTTGSLFTVPGSHVEEKHILENHVPRNVSPTNEQSESFQHYQSHFPVVNKKVGLSPTPRILSGSTFVSHQLSPKPQAIATQNTFPKFDDELPSSIENNVYQKTLEPYHRKGESYSMQKLFSTLAPVRSKFQLDVGSPMSQSMKMSDATFETKGGFNSSEKFDNLTGTNNARKMNGETRNPGEFKHDVHVFRNGEKVDGLYSSHEGEKSPETNEFVQQRPVLNDNNLSAKKYPDDCPVEESASMSPTTRKFTQFLQNETLPERIFISDSENAAHEIFDANFEVDSIHKAGNQNENTGGLSKEMNTEIEYMTINFLKNTNRI